MDSISLSKSVNIYINIPVFINNIFTGLQKDSVYVK